MDRSEPHGYWSANSDGFGNSYANDRDIAVDRDVDIGTDANDTDSDIAGDIDGDIDHDGGYGKGLYLHWDQPSACPAMSLLPPVAPAILDPSLVSFFLDSGPEFEPRWEQQRAALGDKVSLNDYDDYAHGEFLTETCRGVATDEPFALEDLIAAGDKRQQERRTIEERLEEVVEKSLALNILGVLENVAGYVGSRFKVSPRGLYR